MSKINWGRVLLGGLLAGVVTGAFTAVFIPLFGGAWNESLEALGASMPDPTAAFVVGGTALNFATGIVAVWLYAAIRPRYGAGPKAAAIAGFAIWLILALANLSLVLLTNLTVGLVAAIHGPNIVTFVVATQAGAWVYREPTP
jgi:hypothetical protein